MRERRNVSCIKVRKGNTALCPISCLWKTEAKGHIASTICVDESRLFERVSLDAESVVSELTNEVIDKIQLAVALARKSRRAIPGH